MAMLIGPLAKKHDATIGQQPGQRQDLADRLKSTIQKARYMGRCGASTLDGDIDQIALTACCM